MLDIKLIRANTDLIKVNLNRRGKNFDDIIDKILLLDEQRRMARIQSDDMKTKQNLVSKQINDMKKMANPNVNSFINSMRALGNEIKELDSKICKIEQEQFELALTIPNFPHETVPDGLNAEQNQVKRSFLSPTVFPYTPKPHWEIGAELKILDSEAASKVTGPRFHFYKGLGARLERAVINFFLDKHTENGYTEILPPFIVNSQSMVGTGQFPKFLKESYHLENTDYYLIPTAEVPITNIHKDEVLSERQLPLKYCAFSPCFRAESYSTGRDTRGLIRQHQFNKVELVVFSKPKDSYQILEKITDDAENLIKLLQIPYRVVLLSASDLGFSSAKTYDLEVWMPSYNRYVEISSCSNFQDFQARRANIKYKDELSGKSKFLHTLNASGLAVGRTVAAIIENYQNGDGSVSIPDVLQPYMSGIDVIRKY